MKRSVKLILLTVFITVTAVGITACGHRHHSSEERAEWLVQRITDSLDLNDAQQAKLQAIKQEFEQGMKKYHEQRQAFYDRLLEDVQKPQLDKQLLLDMVDSRKQAYDEIAPRLIDKVIDFHASLNAEQKQKIVEHMQKFREHFKEHHKS
jgi:Spy/CpxP family protein refolding chaperone